MWFLLLAQLMGASLSVKVECERLLAPGRLRCTVDATSTTSMQWADLQIVETPDFLQPLRGRLALSEGEMRSAQAVRWQFAAVAKSAAEGELTVRVRALVCPSADQCVPETALATAHVVVGR
jgi:hypothetical protein